MNYFQFFFVLCVSSLLTAVGAQDIHHSQFNQTAFNINPALTGAFNGEVRAIGTYRNQWSQVLRGDAYNSYSISVDSRKELVSEDFIGFGFSGYRDVAGELNFGTTQGTVSAAYGKLIKKDSSQTHYLVGGAQYGIAKRTVDLSGARWPSQHDGNGGFDINSPSPSGFNPNFLHADVNIGLTWLSSFGDRKSLYLGVAAYHVNTPNISFYGDTTVANLAVRKVLHGGGEFPITNQLSIAPSFLYLNQGAHNQINVGAKLRVSNSKKPALSYLQGGIYYRTNRKVNGGIHSDAIIFIGTLKFEQVTLGVSYDYTISELGLAGSSNGALEISAGVILGGQKKENYSFPRY